MIYVKSAPFGLLAAVVSVVVWIVGSVIVGLLRLQAQVPPGAGTLGAVSGPMLDAAQLTGAFVVFLLSATWMYRRLRRRSN
jgi:hypothetical protein